MATTEAPPAGPGPTPGAGSTQRSASRTARPPDPGAASPRRFPRKEAIGLVLAFGLMFTARFAPVLPGLEPRAQIVLGVFGWFVICLAGVKFWFPGNIGGL